MATHYFPLDQVHYTWDTGHAPVLTIADGDTVVFETREVFDNQIGPDSDASVLAGVDWERVYPLAGPVFVAGAEPDVERTREYAESSPSIVTPLNSAIGYEEAAKVAKEALKERKTIRDVVLERGHVDAGKLTVDQLDAALDVLSMARGSKPK